MNAKLPQMQCFLSCEAISQEPSGKRSLHGIFDKVSVPEFPGVFKPFSLFAILWGGSGKRTITLRGTDQDGKPLVDETPVTIAAKFTPKTGNELQIQIGMLPLVKPGVITFDLRVDGKRCGWPCIITIEKAPKVTK